MAKKKKNSAEPKSKKSRNKYRLLNYIMLSISLLVIIYYLDSYHFIRTSDRTLVIQKNHFGFQDTYVDIRKWSVLDLFYHAEVERAILKAGGQKLLTQVKPA